jgi:excisionase family DNA binding protein
VDVSWDQLVFDFGEEVTTRRGIPRLLLTVKQAGLILSVGRTTTYELINAGELQVVHIGRSARVPLHSIEAYVERLRGAQRPYDGSLTSS